MDLRAFTLFNQLSTEIREAIWLYAMKPATVYTKCSRREYVTRPRKQETPVLLQVCRESRIIALKRYEFLSDNDKIYINFDLDTVYIDSGDSLTPLVGPFCSSKNEAKFQYLTVAVDWLDEFPMEALVAKVSRCKSLRLLTLEFGFTTEIDREYKANLSAYLARYKVMTKDKILATVEEILARGGGKGFSSFVSLCEGISALWLYFALDKFPHKDEWPEIFLITTPVITRTRRSPEGNVIPITEIYI
jgi:hypothetical protein